VDPLCLESIVYIQTVQGWARTEPCGTPAYISRGVNTSLSTITHFLLERNELIGLINPAESAVWIYMTSQGAI